MEILFHKLLKEYIKSVQHLPQTYQIKNDVYNEINIKNLLPFLKEQFQNKFEIKGSRNSVRSSTSNRLPYFGSLHTNNEFFIGGMGAWGYTYAPFLAELMVRKIIKEPMIVEQNILKILNIYNRI